MHMDTKYMQFLFFIFLEKVIIIWIKSLQVVLGLLHR